jgi:hypothetical protein
MTYRTGDTPLSINFGVNISEPLDAKNQSVSTFSELATTPFKYKGLHRLVEDEGENGVVYVLGEDLVTWIKSGSNISIKQLTDSSTYIGQNILPSLPASDGAINAFVAGNNIGNATYNEVGDSVIIGSDIGSETSNYFTSHDSVILGKNVALNGKGKFSYSNIIGNSILENYPKVEGYQYVNNMMGYGIMRNILIPNGETDSSIVQFTSFIGNRGLSESTLKNCEITSISCLGESILKEVEVDESVIKATALVGNNLLRRATFTNTTINKNVFVGGNGYLSRWVGGKCEFNSILGVGNVENHSIDGTILDGFSFNCIVGTANLTNGTVGTSGNRNTIVGSFNANLLESGSRNIVVGYASGGSITTGSDNTLIGSSANVSSGSLNNVVVLGSYNATESNSSTIASTGKIFLAPNSSNGVSSTVFELPNTLGSAGDTLVDILGNGVLSWQSPTKIIDTTVKTPTSTGISGQVSYNSGFKYTCVATNVWVREVVDTSW